MKLNNIIYLTLLLSCIKSLQPQNFHKIHHLIIDAGSSGTRFCFYSINKNHSCSLNLNGEACFNVEAEDGLANLNQKKIEKVLNDGFSLLKANLKLKTNEIHYISLLGTGGFRKLSKEDQYLKQQIIDAYFKKHSFHSYKIKFISGEEEAYFAWKAIEIMYHSKNHTILETGGATIQLALYNNNFEFISLPIGMNESYDRLINIKEFAKCTYGNQLSEDTYNECKTMVKNHIYNEPTLKNFLERNVHLILENPVYVLGKAWMSIFNHLKKNPITIGDLESYGKYICKLSENEIVKKNISSHLAKKQCYLFFYHQAQLESLGLNKVFKGIESWTIGASINQNLLPECN